MRIAFVDFIPWDYTIDTPRRRPLGGSQSALCYLAESLAAAGHEVWLLNRTATLHASGGVCCIPLPQVNANLIRGLDAAVVLNDPAGGLALRPHLSSSGQLVLWSQHAADQGAVQALRQGNVRQAYDHFVLVSQWQLGEYLRAFELPAHRCTVLRNAIGPAFGESLGQPLSIASRKPDPPVLAYTSTPYRGLDLLLEVFPEIRRRVTGATLRVYSSMAVYQHDSARDQDKHGRLYDRCRQLEGVGYMGSLPQPQLARQMAEVSLLAYPNTFAETSCLAVAEALATGCLVVTSDLGALPETAAGFATLVPGPQNRSAYARAFVQAVVDQLTFGREHPDGPRWQSVAQIAWYRENYTWTVRARQWIEYLTSQPPRSHLPATARGIAPAIR